MWCIHYRISEIRFWEVYVQVTFHIFGTREIFTSQHPGLINVDFIENSYNFRPNMRLSNLTKHSTYTFNLKKWTKFYGKFSDVVLQRCFQIYEPDLVQSIYLYG